MIIFFQSTSLFIVFLVLNINVLCQDTTSFVYRANVNDSLGVPMVNTKIFSKLSVIGENGKLYYSEIHHTDTDSVGVITLRVGEGSEVQGNLDEVYWNKEDYYIVVEIDSSTYGYKLPVIIHEVFRMSYPIHNENDLFYFGQYLFHQRMIYLYLSERLEKIDTTRFVENDHMELQKIEPVADVLPSVVETNNQRSLNVHDMPEGVYLPSENEIPLLFYQRFKPSVKKTKFLFTSYYYVIKEFNVTYIKLQAPPLK